MLANFKHLTLLSIIFIGLFVFVSNALKVDLSKNSLTQLDSSKNKKNIIISNQNLKKKEIKKNIIKYKRKFKQTPSISLLGLTYKKDVSDIRNSPSLKIFNNLHKKYSKIYLVDPFIKTYKKYSISNANFAIKNSQIIIILINHSAFKKLLKKNNFKNKIILDYCNFNIKY